MHRIRARRALAAALAAAVLALAGCAASAPAPAPADAAPPTPAPAATASAPPDPAERLLAETTDARACAVSFTGEAIAQAPVLQTEGELFRDLPIPRRDGMAFAGWYPTSEDAAAREQVARVNGADMVACTDRRLTLHGAWMPAQDVAALHVGVPILMYHQFTTKPEGERGSLRGNFAYIGDFEAHMKHLADTHVYLPTWDELSAFIDGALYIPRMCAIVTDDDADPTWTTLAAPIVAKYGILTTSFTITSAYPGPPPNPYVIQRSHTHDMHSAGDDGRGRMVNWPADRIAADLNTSADVLGGTRQVMAYPYGHYNDTAKQGLRQAGFEMARTTEPGYVRAGADKLALPTERISYGMGLNAFIAIVG